MYLAEAYRQESGVWPHVLNVSWNPSPYIPPPPEVFEVPMWWWILGSIIVAGVLYLGYHECYAFWITKGWYRFIKVTIRDWLYDNCFETCRCILVKRVNYSTYIMNGQCFLHTSSRKQIEN